MRYDEFADIMREMDMPTAYLQYPVGEVPALPFTVFYYPNTNNFAADDSVFAKIEHVNIELYSANKSFAAESSVESVLEAHGLPWDKTEAYLDSENMYEVLYEVEIIING